MNQEVKKDGNYQVARLLGLLVKPSTSLHPSRTSHGRRFKTASICRVHLDLVQVRSGQVYKLRSPNVGYQVMMHPIQPRGGDFLRYPTKRSGKAVMPRHHAKFPQIK